MVSVATIILVGLLACGGSTRSVDQDESVMFGTLHALESGQVQYRLNRRDISGINKSRVHSLRLDLGSDVAPVDMELSQKSAWTDDSLIVERQGESLNTIHGAVDSSCYLSGRLISHNGGVASFNRCGRLSGTIETDKHFYAIEEVEEGDSDSEMSKVKVVRSRSQGLTSAEDTFMLGNGEQDGIVKRQYFNGRNVVVELAVYLDANFVEYQRTTRGHRTTAQLTNWIIEKFNKFREVYGNEQEAGLPIDVQLKKVEIWYTNPPYYQALGDRNLMSNYLHVFCTETPALPSYDHKMLYSYNTSRDHFMGMANLNKICHPDMKCSFVKGRADRITLELHEFGHSLGLKHDPDLAPCTDTYGDGGFMGWGTNYRFMDCYRRVLRRTLRESDKGCLYQTNVNRPVMNGPEEPSEPSEPSC